jgi:ABC-type multidrug transport system fused ATPase/permease subunit
MVKQKIWWPFVQQNKWWVAGIIVLGFLASFVTLLLPLSIGKYMEIVFETETGKTRALQLLGINLPGSIFVFFLFFSALLLVKFFCSWLQQYQAALLGESFVASLRYKLFTHQLTAKAETVPGKNDTASLLAYSNDAKLLQQLLVKGVIGFTKEVLFLLMALYVLFSLNSTLTMIVAFLITDFYLIQRWYNRRQKNIFTEKRKRHGSLLNHVSKTILTKELTKEDSLHLFSQKSAKLKNTLKKYHLQKSLLRALAPLLLYAMLAIIMAFIVWDINNENFSASEVITYILLLMSIFPTIRNIIKVEQTWLHGRLSARKFNNLDKSKSPDTEKPPTRFLKIVTDNI